MNFLRAHRTPLLFALLCALLYGSFAYDLVRTDFTKLITLYGALFFITYRLVQWYGLNFWLLAGFGIVFRLLLLPAMPNLSQDFYRFIWDGQVMAQGYSPYAFTPEMYLSGIVAAPDLHIAQAETLISGMGSLNAGHFSNYPPVNQLIFMVSVLAGGKGILGSVVAMRSLLIVADLGILYLGKKLLERLGLPVQNIFWYFLNPFIIIELTGNLHFEGMMLLFLTWSLYLLYRGKWVLASVLLGISISVKLIPLLFLPLFYHFFADRGLMTKGFWKLIKFYLITVGTVGLCFLPFYSQSFATNFFATIRLWFQDFEFNASIFYIIRWIGFQTVGWDPIQTAGKVLPALVLLIVLLLSFLRKNNSLQILVKTMLFSISVYFLLATTIHPWYIATPLLLSVFTNYRFPLVWTAVVMLSYSAYTSEGFSENLWLVTVEYVILGTYALWEFLSKRESIQPII